MESYVVIDDTFNGIVIDGGEFVINGILAGFLWKIGFKGCIQGER